MLSRTASHLFWMSRYLERAENLARMLDVSHNLSLLPQSHGAMQELSAPLAITGTLTAFHTQYESLTAQNLLQFMALDLGNPASILSCLKNARENAHAVRGRITAEMWENINSTWLEGRRLPDLGVGSVSQFFEWVKDRSHLFRGVTYGTILRNDAYTFIRLGTFLERADNTARILDVKSHLMQPQFEGSAPDYYHWNALLRSLSAFEAYQEIYRDAINAQQVGELLILRPDMPRSLRASVDELHTILQTMKGDTGRVPQRLVTELQASLRYGMMDEIFERGLHGYITDFLAQINQLGELLHEAYLDAA